VAVVLVGAGFVASRRRIQIAVATTEAAGRLTRGYWLTWILIVLGVSVEFSLVFWASTLVERQTGISLADATLVATSFYAGMATSRTALSFHLVSGRDPIALIRLGLAIALTGSLVAWTALDVVSSGLGIYLGGLGTGFLYPLGVAVALAFVPESQDRGSARLILASGVAILLAPFVLGVAADATSVAVGWLLIPALCVVALALTVVVGRTPGAVTALPPASPARSG
jgi:fucose permease